MHSFLYPALPAEALAKAGPDTLHIYPETSIGIEEIRAIQHFLSRKPSQSSQNIVVIHDAHKLTLPAQHALLKTLEEPPGNSLIYLITSYPDTLLPTILSRVQIINSPYMSNLSYPSYLPDLLKSEVKDRLKILDAKNFTRDQAFEFLNQFEHYIHRCIAKGNYTLNASDYTLIFDTRKYLKANCSVKLALDHLALNIR